MAIAIVETGTFIKLYSEAIENLDRKQVDGVTAAGGNWLHRIGFGVLPQVLPMMLSNTLYMFEHNVQVCIDPRHRRRGRHRLPACGPLTRL